MPGNREDRSNNQRAKQLIRARARALGVRAEDRGGRRRNGLQRAATTLLVPPALNARAKNIENDVCYQYEVGENQVETCLRPGREMTK